MSSYAESGFSLVIVILISAFVGICSFAGLNIYKANHHLPPTITEARHKQNPIANPIPGCNNQGRIIVAFNITSKERERAIIATEKTTISKEYSSLNGYLLNVTRGREKAAINAFLKYPEVETASLENCNSTNSTQSM